MPLSDHLDEETLGLLALGEDVHGGDPAHLRTCESCQDELATLSSVVRLARGALTHVVEAGDDLDATEGLPLTPIPPPPAVWERIAAATGVTVGARQDRVDAPPVRAAVNGVVAPGKMVGRRNVRLRAVDLMPLNGAARSADRSPAEDLFDEAEPELVPGAPGPRPAPRGIATAGRPKQGRRRRRGASALVGAAAAGLLIGLGGGVAGSTWLQDRTSSSPAPARSVLADAQLTGLALAPAAAGEASVVRTADGDRLSVDVRRLDAVNGFYEVWLMTPGIDRMVAVGVLSGGRGEFAIPAGLDLSRYPTVDVSVQGFKNAGQHSGKSVLRGELRS